MSDDLATIQQQIDALEAKKKALVEQNRSGALSEVKKTIGLYGFSAGDLGLDVPGKKSKAKKVAKPVTFRDATNPAEIKEWDGTLDQKGRKPEWIKLAVDNGTIDQFRVKTA